MAVTLKCAFAAMAMLLLPALAAADAREGYYYPEVASSEEFAIRLNEDPALASVVERVEFLTELAARQRARAYAPRISFFAKGHEARKLIGIGMDNEVFETLFRARAALADLTAEARATPLLRERKMHTIVTFLDILTMLGFEELTISDGKTWSHRIVFVQRPPGD